MSDPKRTENRELTQIIYVSDSEIHGQGIYAKRVIEEGEYIGSYSGPQARRNGTYVLWVSESEEKVIGISGKNHLRYLNHAKSGNAEFDGCDLFALRLIEPDEEITFDYGEDWA